MADNGRKSGVFAQNLAERLLALHEQAAADSAAALRAAEERHAARIRELEELIRDLGSEWGADVADLRERIARLEGKATKTVAGGAGAGALVVAVIEAIQAMGGM